MKNMTYSMKTRLLFMATGTMLMLGCSLAPAPKNIEVPGRNAQAFQGDKSDSRFTSTSWWEQFHDDELNHQIKDVLENAPDAEAILAHLAAVQEQANIAGAPLLPTVGIEANGSRSKTYLGTFFPQGGSFTNNSFGLELSASYQVDIWGKLSDTAKIAQLSLLEAEENRNIVFQTLVANTVELYTQLSQARQEAKFRTEAVAAISDLEKSMKSGYLAGTIDTADYLATTQKLATTRQALSITETRIAGLEASLNALAGRDIHTPILCTDFSNFPSRMAPIASGLPSELLNRRPDIRTARLKVDTALLQVGIARTELLPSFSLTARKGYKNNDLSQLVDSPSSVWTLMGGIVQPLFNRGAKRAAVRQAHRSVEATIAEYRKTALNAFKEVETALNNFADASGRLKLETESVTSETVKVNQARASYLAGTTGIQPLISARLAYLNRLISRDQVALSMIQNRVRLATALGDGLNVYRTISGESK